jgi:hypothetical protein
MAREMVLKINDTDSYLEQLLKLVPAEAIGAYTVLLGLVPPEDPMQYWVPFVVGLVLVVGIRCLKAETVTYGVTDISVVIISVAAYLVWVYNIEGLFRVYNWYNPLAAASLLIIVTVLGPLVYDKVGIPLNKRYAGLRGKSSTPKSP